MIRVYLSNYWDIESQETPPNTPLSPIFGFYNYNKSYVRSIQDISNAVIGLDIEHVDFFVRKDTSKARLQLVTNEGMVDSSIGHDTIDNIARLLFDTAKNRNLIFNKDTLRLGSMITIIDDEFTYSGDPFETVSTFTGEKMELTRNDDGSYKATPTGIIETETIIASDQFIYERARKLFVGRITELNNDHERVDITCENCMYEFRNVYQNFYSTLVKYKAYDAKKDTKNVGLRATAGDVINICKHLLTGMNPISAHKHAKDTNLIYDVKYQFLVKPSDVSNKSLLDIMNWALQMHWRNFVVENKLAINRAGNEYFADLFQVSSDNDAKTEELAYSYPVVRFDYNHDSLSTPISINSLIISTFYEINKAKDDEKDNSVRTYGSTPINVNGYNVTLLNPDNVVSYKYNRSTKNLVNELDMYGTEKDDIGNVSIKQHFLYPQNVDAAKEKETEMFWRSRIKYGIHRLTRGVDLIDNTISLETFAKDIGSILCEPDYGLTVNIVSYNGIQLNDAVLLNLSNSSSIVYEVKNLTYRLNDGRTDATLDLKPVLVIIPNTKETTPMSLNANGKK